MDRTRMPSWMSAEAAERLSDIAANDFSEFSEYEDSHIGAIAPYELQKPIAHLLHLRNQLELARRVEGLDKDKALDWIAEGLDELYTACVERWKYAT